MHFPATAHHDEREDKDMKEHTLRQTGGGQQRQGIGVSGHPVSRRAFLSTLGTAAGVLAAGGCGKKNPTKSTPEQPWTPPEVPGSSTVAVREVQTYTRRELRNTLSQMFDDLGGISDLVNGKTVGIKINLTGGSGSANTTPPAVELFWTHPEVLKAVGELAKDAGAKKLYVVEAVYDWGSFTDFGFKTVADGLGATLVDLNDVKPSGAYVQRSVGGGWLIYQSLTQNAVLNDCECFISLPKAKQHVGAGVTHAMKNLVGTLPVPSGLYNAGASNRSGIHQIRKYDGNTNSNLRRVVVDLNQATKIHLAVTDAVMTASGGEGPWNRGFEPATFNRMIVSKDVVAADVIATKVIGFDPMAADGEGVFAEGINYFKLANEKGLGNWDLAKIQVIGVPV
jgi:uncharacterized protein (DUF362 family)